MSFAGVSKATSLLLCITHAACQSKIKLSNSPTWTTFNSIRYWASPKFPQGGITGPVEPASFYFSLITQQVSGIYLNEANVPIDVCDATTFPGTPAKTSRTNQSVIAFAVQFDLWHCSPAKAGPRNMPNFWNGFFNAGFQAVLFWSAELLAQSGQLLGAAYFSDLTFEAKGCIAFGGTLYSSRSKPPDENTLFEMNIANLLLGSNATLEAVVDPDYEYWQQTVLKHSSLFLRRSIAWFFFGPC